MAKKEKQQEKHQKDLEKQSNEVEDTKKYTEILSRVINEGEEVFKIKKITLFLSACIAGLEIGFSYLLICMLYFLLGGSVDEQVIFKLFGLAYPLGFVLVIMGKSALFTEQTSVLALPVLNGQRTFLEMLSVWGWVILGNLIGGILFVFFIGAMASELSLFDQDTMAKIGIHVVDHKYWVLFLSAISAGWLMGLLTWLLNTTVDVLTRILIIFIITGTIGFIGFHHSIVGNLEAFGALLYSDDVSLIDYLMFLLLTLVGNGIGGAIVVGLFKYRIFESNKK
ncbi:formate/nitrite transporter family protein [Mesonia ostreae]|uniref:Formate/nitrite transporter family protein n=1 Tax=Mesonia ostreae TaxID=861110 RepID=A0ABU2KKT6_9FLAO|nr:formate/nitrite transporter family protein [Mesonia ostreae]MDT0295352.1 formate/nitrite transporter family protein [Mesonia ostreae]